MDRLQAMRLFTSIVELGSFSRAAEQLGLPRASATQIIQQLEATSACACSRTTRQVTPPWTARATTGAACDAADLDDAEAEFSGRASSTGASASTCRFTRRLPLIPAYPTSTRAIRWSASRSASATARST